MSTDPTFGRSTLTTLRQVIKTSGRKILILVIGSLLLSQVAMAQSLPCGNIIGPEDLGDSNSTTTTRAIINCQDPFNKTNTLEEFYLNGELVTDGATYTISATGTDQYGLSKYNPYFMDGEVQVYKHENNNYQFIDTKAIPNTEAEYRTLAEQFFTVPADVDHYLLILADSDNDIYFEDENGEPLIDQTTGLTVYERFDDFIAYLDEHLIIRRPPLFPGTHTAVMSTGIITVSQKEPDNYFVSKLIAFFLPRAYAKYIIPDEIHVITFTLLAETPPPTGASSVLFLPGIQASRLYKDGLFGSEDQLWEPNNPFNDVNQLGMNEFGISDNSLYTKDVIDTAPGNFDIYRNFINFLSKQKTEELIKDYQLFAYDWRYDVFDVVKNGAAHQNEIVKPDQLLRSLAEQSNTGKVTIVAHSNGGLLAKALLIEYPDLAGLVDRIIFIGSPQLGTPKAIGSVLHGFEQDLAEGWFLQARDARATLINFPGVYGLLPGEKYLNLATDRIISFDNSMETTSFRKAYGDTIDNQTELLDFMIGAKDKRPPAQFTNDIALANTNLLQSSYTEDRPTLDNWTAPDQIAVTEIVGVGLNTVAGFHYQGFGCGRVNCGLFGRIYKPIPMISQYGDQTVMAISAEAYSGNKETYYVELDNLFQDTRIKIEHANLTESQSIQQLILDLLTNTTPDSIPFITNLRPTYSENRVMLAVHSPVSILVEDSGGELVGKVGRTTEGFPIYREDIPGSSYFELGESKYIIIPAGIKYEIKIKGEDSGSMTFTVHELSGENQTEIINIPIQGITSSTSIRLENTGTEFTNLIVDKDGDLVKDLEITPAGEIVYSSPTELMTYATFMSEVKKLDLAKKYQTPLLAVIKMAQIIKDKDLGKLDNLAERIAVQKIKKLLKVYKKKKIITTVDYDRLISIVDQISDSK